MLLTLIAHIIIDALNLAIGSYVLFKNPRGIVRRSFFLFVFGIVGWSVSMLLLSSTGQAWLTTLPFLSAEIMVLGFVFLAEVFPDGNVPDKRCLICLAPWLVIVLLTPTGLVVHTARFNAGHLETSYGPLILLFGALMGAYILWGVGKLFSKYRRLEGIQRVQIRYLTIGAGLFLFFAFITNVILPACHIFSFNLLGPLFSVVFIGMAAYAIIKHQFLDIAFVIQRSVVYAFLIGIIACIFFGIDLIIRRFTQVEGWGDDVAAAIIGAFGFVWLRRFFERITDPIFFRRNYQYDAAVHELGPLLHSSINLETLLQAIDGFLARTVKPERTVFLVQDAGGKCLVRSFFHGARVPAEKIKYEAAMAALAAETRAMSFFQEQGKSSDAGTGIAAIIPLFAREGSAAVMLLGNKLSGDIFRLKDIELLSVLAHQAGIAIENARLYEAAQRYSETLERRVCERTAELQSMQEAQSKFVTDISHELKTPVTVLRANMEVLEGKRKGNRKTALAVASTTLGRMAQMVDHLLAIARLNFSKEKLHKQEILVENLLEEVYNDCSILAENAGVLLSYASDSISLFADKEKLKAVILNLISNALKHTSRGGRITLLGRAARERAEIIVEDTGSGITPEDMPHIFERFYRISGDRSSGTGLGLDICKKIAEMHSSTITVESAIGKGSKFVVSLPVGPSDARET